MWLIGDAIESSLLTPHKPFKSYKEDLESDNDDLEDHKDDDSDPDFSYTAPKKIAKDVKSKARRGKIKPKMKDNDAKKKRKKAIEENPNKFQCQFCPEFKTMQKLSLRKHITRYHSDEYQDDEIHTEEIETKDYLCSKCNESFNDLLKVWFTIKS